MKIVFTKLMMASLILTLISCGTTSKNRKKNEQL